MKEFLNRWSIIIFLIFFGFIIWVIISIGLDNNILGIIVALGIVGFLLIIILLLDLLRKKLR